MTLFEEGPTELLPYDGSALLYPWVLGAQSSTAVMDELLESVPWESHNIRMFGKEFPQPRLVAWFGDPGSEYSYSGIKMNVRPWTRSVAALKAIAESYSGAIFNSVLINLYRNGDDKVSWHKDDERELGSTPTIASLSLGASRRFKFRHVTTKEVVETILLSGSLVIMSGLSQTCWEHEVPRQAPVKEPRINLTFRQVHCA